MFVIVDEVDGERVVVLLAFVRRLLGTLSRSCKRLLAGIVTAGLLLANLSKSESMVEKTHGGCNSLGLQTVVRRAIPEVVRKTLRWRITKTDI